MRRFVLLLCGTIGICAARLDAQARISGTVYDSLTSQGPLRGATIVLIEQGRYATSDDRGRFAIDSVAPGKYSIGFMHPVLDSLGLFVPAILVEVPAIGIVRVKLSTPSPATAYARLCPGKRDDATGVLYGRVSDVDSDAALPGADIFTDWTEILLSALTREDRRLQATVQADADGTYRLCGVPLRIALDVRASADGFGGGPLRLVVGDGLMARADFAISHSDSAARDSTTRDSTAERPGSAALRGTVRDASGRAVPNALVGLVGQSRTVHTDRDGAFVLAGIPAGTRTAEVRSIGKPPAYFGITLQSHHEQTAAFVLDRVIPLLAPMTVVARGAGTSAMNRSGFAERRSRGLGAFLTAADIAKIGGFDLGELLSRVRGVRTTSMNGDLVPTFMGPRGMPCVPNFFLDGIAFMVDGGRASNTVRYPFTDLASVITPNMIRGIEVYSSAGTIPMEYDRSSFTGCGSILIWTR